MNERPSIRAAPPAATVLLAVFCGVPQSAATAQVERLSKGGAEGLAELADECIGARPDFEVPCREVALAALAVQRGVGVASSLGSEIAGTPSTLGRRIGRMPRVSLFLSVVGTRLAIPRVAGSSAEDLSERHAFSVPGLRAGAAAGVLNGFQLTPNLGGVFSLDLFASYSLLRLPSSAGFGGADSGFGLGARMGLVRESFVLPGISVSAGRRWHGEIGAGSEEGPAGARAKLTVSSLRAVAGKNWFAIGVMGGAGWDQYSGNARIGVDLGPSGYGIANERVTSDRLVYFVGGWFNFLVSQLSLEAGMADGLEDPFPGRDGAFDVTARTWFVSAAYRVVL